MNTCMRMSSGALSSLCRVWLTERQAGAMMSPSLANKLWLTLWEPGSKGNGTEWECTIVVPQESIHWRWEAVVMLGEWRWQIFMKPLQGWRADDHSHWHLCERWGSPYSNKSIWHNFFISYRWLQEKSTITLPHVSFQALALSCPNTKQQEKTKKIQTRACSSVL